MFCTTENPIHFNVFEGGLIIGFLSWLNEPMTGGGAGGAGGVYKWQFKVTCKVFFCFSLKYTHS